MSNSAIKKARRRSNLFESDYDELIFSSNPIKIKNVEVEKVKKTKSTNQGKAPESTIGEAISKVLVNCSCNSCGAAIEGTLIGIMYSPLSRLNTPFISYNCKSCNKSGKRAVQAKALPTEQFERTYF